MKKRSTILLLCLLILLFSAIILIWVIDMKNKKASAALLAEQLLSGKKDAIALVRESGPVTTGASKIGGIPDLPADFRWPYFEGADYAGVRKSRPLSFLAQIDLSQAADFDSDGLLPHTGMLYFFYELQTMAWGGLEDDGCARVYYYDVSPDALRPTTPPGSLPASLMVPEAPLRLQGKVSYPSYEELPLSELSSAERFRIYDLYEAQLQQNGVELEHDPADCFQLLGYAELIQGSILLECALHSAGLSWRDYAQLSSAEQQSLQKAGGDWTLLAQFGTLSDELMFGDCGCIYFYIRKDDLAARRFDRIYLCLQCG